MKLLFLAPALSIALLSAKATARADNLTLMTPDVVFECYAAGKIVSTCWFNCGNQLMAGQAGEAPPVPDSSAVGSQGASRIELFSNGSPGRTDTRTWIAYSEGNNPNPTLNKVTVLYVAPNWLCQFPNVTTKGDGLRMELFHQ
jgi:hypothetical protein